MKTKAHNPIGAATPPIALWIVAALAGTKLLLHLLTNAFGPYEFHRDEFLYFAMGEPRQTLQEIWPSMRGIN